MDTSSDESGTNVKPQVIRNYDGTDIVLPGDARKVLRPSENPILAERAGHDIVTTDGTTLLGADDKALGARSPTSRRTPRSSTLPSVSASRSTRRWAAVSITRHQDSADFATRLTARDRPNRRRFLHRR
jgi:hypothetical protein